VYLSTIDRTISLRPGTKEHRSSSVVPAISSQGGKPPITAGRGSQGAGCSPPPPLPPPPSAVLGGGRRVEVCTRERSALLCQAPLNAPSEPPHTRLYVVYLLNVMPTIEMLSVNRSSTEPRRPDGPGSYRATNTIIRYTRQQSDVRRVLARVGGGHKPSAEQSSSFAAACVVFRDREAPGQQGAAHPAITTPPCCGWRHEPETGSRLTVVYPAELSFNAVDIAPAGSPRLKTVCENAFLASWAGLTSSAMTTRGKVSEDRVPSRTLPVPRPRAASERSGPRVSLALQSGPASSR